MSTNSILNSLFGISSSLSTHSINTNAFKEESKHCERCQRRTHSTANCHAKTDILGKELEGTKDLLSKLQPKKNKVPQVSKKVQKKKVAVKKKSPCIMWENGKCMLGDTCLYSHQGPGFDPRSRQLCSFFRSGRCLKGELCDYSHNTKLFACAFHHWKGGCRSTAQDCPFSHDPMSPEQEAELERDQKKFNDKNVGALVA